MPKSSTSWARGKSGNPSGRPKGIEKMTREEIEAFTYNFGDPVGVLSGWKALRFRAFMIAMRGEDKDANVMIKWLHDRGYGMPKQAISIEEGSSAVDLSELTEEQVEALASMKVIEAPVDATEH